MSFLKTIWGLLFRLFPCPTRVGLRKVGDPKRDSPVLVTCNFDLTVKRLTRILERAAVDAWLLVADSKGVNVWCAAGGDEFNTRSVVSAVKTSDVGDLVDHRRLILPPLGAPGIRAADIREHTGWSPRWGPVTASDLGRYLSGGCRRDEEMKRVTYTCRERLDTALGSLFPFFFLGALGFLIFGRELLATYLLVGAGAFVFFFLACPWIPGERGITKVMILEAALAGLLLAGELWSGPGPSPARAPLIIAMAMFLVYATELGGLASTMPSDLDPFMARLGVGAVGNVAWAGTVRTELLNGYSELIDNQDVCSGCRQCYEVCPQRVWEMNDDNRAVLAHRGACTACRACLTQCPTGAIQAVTQKE